MCYRYYNAIGCCGIGYNQAYDIVLTQKRVSAVLCMSMGLIMSITCQKCAKLLLCIVYLIDVQLVLHLSTKREIS